MAGVGTGVGGHAVVETFYKGLQVIVPSGGIGRALHEGDEHGTQVVVLEKLFLLVGQVAGLGSALLKRLAAVVGGRIGLALAHGDGLVGAVEHQAGDFFYR